MQFEWDAEKDALNIRKHGLSFAYAALIFERPTLDKADDRFDYGEMRTLRIGTVDGIAILAV